MILADVDVFEMFDKGRRVIQLVFPQKVFVPLFSLVHICTKLQAPTIVCGLGSWHALIM